jgi:catechol 2,3-dioxygenase-like lactoylglutathione lyase family enzyme
MTEGNKAGIFEYLDTTIIRVSDIIRSKKWYEKILKLVPILFDENEKLVVYHAGNNLSFTIWQIKPDEKLVPTSLRGAFPIFYTKDILSIHNTLQEQRVKVEEIQGSEHVKFFGFYDPDNNRIEVCHYSQ